MFNNVINNSEWKKIIAKEFSSYKQTRKIIREKLIRENNEEKRKKIKTARYLNSKKRKRKMLQKFFLKVDPFVKTIIAFQ